MLPERSMGSRLLEALVVAVLLLATAWSYAWTLFPDYQISLTDRTANDYYAYLTSGFLKGHLYLDVKPDPFLATLKDPGDPGERAGHGMHDASYFNGRYYIYFGVTPVLILFLPFKVVTGRYLTIKAACLVFSLVGLGAASWILLAARVRYFPKTSVYYVALAVASLGLSNMTGVLMRRPGVWEAPIIAAYCCATVALAFLYQALHSPRRWPWMGLASAALGLAVGARPTYLFGCLGLAGPLLYWSRQLGGPLKAARDRSWRISFCAAVLPLAAIGAGLAIYNYERFGSMSEFGLRYQMSGQNMAMATFFNWRFPLYGFRVYWLAPATWSAYFPFVSVAPVPPGPGVMAIEDPYGILPNIPFALFALGTLALAGGNARKLQPRIGAFCVTAAFLTFLTMAVTISFGSITNRYMVDFVPGVILLAALGLLTIASSGSHRRAISFFVGSGAGALALFSIGFNAFASIRHNELLRVEYPEEYEKLAHTWNTLPYLFDRWIHNGYGPLELTIDFASHPTGKLEPLVVTGHAFLADYLVIQYLPYSAASFGIIHTSHPPVFGPPVTLAPGIPHVVRIDMGSLYPPPGHPYFDGMEPAAARLRQSLARVTVDGKVALETRLQTYDAYSLEPMIGRSEPGLSFDAIPFTGTILRTRRLPDNPALAERN